MRRIEVHISPQHLLLTLITAIEFHMGGWKSKGSKYLSGAFSSSSDPNLAGNPAGRPAGGQPEQSLGEQKSSLSPPAMTRGSRFLDNLKRRFRSPSPSSSSSGVKHHNNTTTQATAASSLTASASAPARPHSSYSETSTIRAHGPSPHDLSLLANRRNVTTGGNVTAGGNITAVFSSEDNSPSSSDGRGSPFASVSAPTVRVSYCEPIAGDNPTSSTHALHSPTSTTHVQAPTKTDVHTAILPHTKSIPGPGVIGPSSQSSVVWAKTLEIAKQKLSDKNLPPLDLTNITSQSAEENIEAVIKTLITIQKDDKRKQWSYNWRGKEVIVVEHLGKFLKTAEKYSKVVDTAVQSNPEVTALVWAGIRAIMQVRMSFRDINEPKPNSVARLL